MATSDFTTTLVVNRSPEEVFNAVTNVRGWWSEEIEGGTEKLNDVFQYHYEDLHRSTIKLIEVIPFQKVVWLLEKNYFKFTEDKTELTNTTVSFEISKKGNQTQLRFTHAGLVPACECYEICSDAWTQYIQESLFNLVTIGTGKPNATGKPQTENEKKLRAK